MVQERGCRVQVLAQKKDPQRTLSTRDGKVLAMKVGILVPESP